MVNFIEKKINIKQDKQVIKIVLLKILKNKCFFVNLSLFHIKIKNYFETISFIKHE